MVIVLCLSCKHGQCYYIVMFLLCFDFSYKLSSFYGCHGVKDLTPVPTVGAVVFKLTSLPCLIG